MECERIARLFSSWSPRPPQVLEEVGGVVPRMLDALRVAVAQKGGVEGVQLGQQLVAGLTQALPQSALGGAIGQMLGGETVEHTASVLQDLLSVLPGRGLRVARTRPVGRAPGSSGGAWPRPASPSGGSGGAPCASSRGAQRGPARGQLNALSPTAGGRPGRAPPSFQS